MTEATAETETTADLVYQIVELNTDSQRLPTISAEKIVSTLAQSGVSEGEIHDALDCLVTREKLVRTEAGYHPASTPAAEPLTNER